MHWKVKAISQQLLSVLPGGVAVNDVLQSALGGHRQPEQLIAAKFNKDWLVFMEHFREIGRQCRGLVFCEIGTGWLPVLPLCFLLSGAKLVNTFDLYRHLNARFMQVTVAALRGYLPAIAAAAGMSTVDDAYGRLTISGSLSRQLDNAGIRYHAPADFCQSTLAPESVDVVFSNSVLEHVPAAVIPAMMRESYRILKPDGIVMHSVNCGDHYAYVDATITQLNYLRFSARQWRYWNCARQYQNRLRAVDFITAAAEAGFSIILNKQKPRPELLAGIPVAAEFNNYPPEQLCTTSVDFVGIKSG